MPDGAFRFAPGEGFEVYDDEPSPAEQLAKLKLDESMSPVFLEPEGVMESEHAILGKVTTETYKNIFGNLLWHMSRDEAGRVWISGITAPNERVNSYGASEEVSLAGVFDNKPLEYTVQTEGLVEGKDYYRLKGQETYVDITPLLDNLPIIQQYRAAKGIVRT